MRTVSHLLALAVVAACGGDGLGPGTSEEGSETAEPTPPRCGDGLVNDESVCLRSFTVDVPYAYEFIRHADFDGDGRRDFFAINSSFRVFWALFFTGGVESGGPKFLVSYEFENYESFRPVILDFDGDGLMDLASPANFWYFVSDHETGNIRLIAWRNRGNYEFEVVGETFASAEPLVASFATGDIDGDGRTDLFGVGTHETAFVWAYVPAIDELDFIRLVDFKPLQLSGQPLIAAADHDGDVHADFVLMDGTGRAWRIVGGPEHQLTIQDPGRQDVVLTPGSQTLYARDINADGLVDLAAVRFEYPKGDPVHTISLALGQPGGGFAPLTSFDAAYPLTSAGYEFSSKEDRVVHLGFFDLDGSGQLALVYAHDGRPELVIHPHIAETRGAAPVIVPLDFPANSLFVDDFEDDGEDAIYVGISHITDVKPSVDNPDGKVGAHYLVRFSPDP